jgi:hypothetical protein
VDGYLGALGLSGLHRSPGVRLTSGRPPTLAQSIEDWIAELDGSRGRGVSRETALRIRRHLGVLTLAMAAAGAQTLAPHSLSPAALSHAIEHAVEWMRQQGYGPGAQRAAAATWRRFLAWSFLSEADHMPLESGGIETHPVGFSDHELRELFTVAA